ncbi:MAG: PAS domain S-box protein [Alphaproteobacteria bacterium]|nr:PAS domain S-box protein [Alphaproteobacteria bacterium]
MAEMSRHRITFKLALAAALVALLLGFALGAVKASLDFARETDSLKVVVMRTLAVAKPTAARAVVVIDTNLAREVIDGLLEYDFVNSAKIIDDLGEVMAVVSKTQAGAEKHWLAWLVGSVQRDYSIPLLDDPAYTQQGSLEITIYPVRAFSPFLDRVIHEISLTLVGAFAFAFVLMVAFQVLVTRPMVTLAEAFDRISPREPGKSLLPTAIAQQEDELGMVARSGNQLLTAIQDLLHQRNLAEERIRTIAEAVSSVSGDNVLDSLVESLVEILGIDIAFVGVFADDRASWVRTLTVFADGAKADNFEYALAGTPCQGVVGRTACIFNGNVQHEFPDDKLLIEMGMETYVGAPLFDSEDVLVGIIVALNRKPLENPETVSDLLHFFGVRAAAELERCHAETMLRESEERLRAVLDNSPAHIFMKDRDGHYILVNRQFEESHIASGGAIRGKTAHDIYPKEVADVIRRNDLEVLEKNAAVEFEEVIPHPDGDQTFISVKFPLRDASGEPYAVCCVATDITARKEAENALAIQTRNLEIAEQIASIGHWRIDVATRDIFFSDEMYRLHGFVVGSDITWSMLSDASHPDDWKLVEEADRKAIEEKKGSELDRRVIWPNGETRVLHSMSRVELGDDGEVAAIVGVSQDITERKQAEEELARAEIRYRSIVENSTDGIFRSNEEGRLLWANTALARMGGFETAEELLSAVKDIKTDIFVNPDDRKNLIE